MNLGLMAIDVWLVALGLMVPAWSYWLPVLLRGARQFTPEARARRLLGYALAPWAFAWLSVALAFLPTWMANSGWVSDWCLSRHPGLESACPMHGSVGPLGTLALVLAILVLLLAVFMALRALWMIWVACAVAARLSLVRESSIQVHGLQVDLIDSAQPVALSLCLPRQRVVVSGAVARALDESEFHALIEHERAHLARRDGYAMVVMAIASSILLPSAGRQLRAEWKLAIEQSCDRVAAYRVGALPLASALIKFARIAGAQPCATAMLPGFGQADLHARVDALLLPGNGGTVPLIRLRWSLAWCLPLAFVLHELGEFVLLPLVR
jgi:hypothetical protein